MLSNSEIAESNYWFQMIRVYHVLSFSKCDCQPPEPESEMRSVKDTVSRSESEFWGVGTWTMNAFFLNSRGNFHLYYSLRFSFPHQLHPAVVKSFSLP